MRTRPKPKQYDLDAAGRFFAETVHRKARCIVCGTPKELQAHHAVPKTWLKQVAKRLRMSNEERNALLWDSRNGTALCTRCHELHTVAHKRVERYRLPLRVWSFVEHVDRLLGTEEASVRVEREYP